MDIHERFKISIDGVNPASYNTSFFVLQDNIYLAMNFSTEFENKELRLISDPFNPVLVRSPFPQESLVLFEAERSHIVSGSPLTEVETAQKLGKFTKTVSVIGNVIGNYAPFGMAFSSMDPGNHFVKLSQLTKLYSRLKYINIYYGSTLDEYLENFGSSFDPKSNSSQKDIAEKTKQYLGKFAEYNMSLSIFEFQTL